MALSERERRELAGIEQALLDADPALAAAFVQPAVWPGARLARVLAGWFVAVAVLLLLAGLIWRDSGMLIGGCLVLCCMPVCVLLVAHLSPGGGR